MRARTFLGRVFTALCAVLKIDAALHKRSMALKRCSGKSNLQVSFRAFEIQIADAEIRPEFYIQPRYSCKLVAFLIHRVVKFLIVFELIQILQ